MGLVGRQTERRELEAAAKSPTAELVAIYGRRRVGKTFLVREIYGDSICFELVGMHDAPLTKQLRAFASSLQQATGTPTLPPADWQAAFEALRVMLTAHLRRRTKKQVVFFDEVPWLASRRSGFLSAFEHFWNSWASREPKLVVVVCGSAASWMLDKIVRQRGGLHNRITRRLRVEPFSLAETALMLRERRVELGPYQTIELYMAMGGIPHYLAQVRAGESAAQNIDRICFARDGLLHDEFANLYASLFEKAERHESVVRVLATKRRGLTRNEILAQSSIGSGGAATKVLEELEESGFIMHLPQLARAKRDAVYWLADEYSLFYLTWIEKHRGRGDNVWMKKQGTPAWRAWSGLAFEATCLKHVGAIKRALGIAGVDSVDATWAHRADAQADGAQIDLVIDRADRSTNLCEMKFSEGPFAIDKGYARELAHKRDTFRALTGTNKALFLTLVTTYGVRDNEHATNLGIQSIVMDALFT